MSEWNFAAEKDRTLTRRAALGTVGALGAAAIAAPGLAQPGRRARIRVNPLTDVWDSAKGEYILPPLPYAYEALEPHIDAQTMTIHHDTHHAGYVGGANKALAELAKIRDGSGDASLIQHWERQLAFHISGHLNHARFWRTMAPTDAGGGGRPGGALDRAISRDFGSFEQFEAHFKAAAASVEGGGWGWLVLEPASGRLRVAQTMNQQNESILGAVPLLGVDVWEHAYYLRYQNRRGDYLTAFMNVVNWSAVEDFHQWAIG